MRNLEIYRYSLNCYLLPNSMIASGGSLINETMETIRLKVKPLKHEWLSTNYAPNEAIAEGKKQLTEYEGHTWQLDAVSREKLDLIQKNLEFCERAELASPYKKEDMWEYINWTVNNLLAEEFKEVKDAAKVNDPIETIDGACDVAVLALNIPYKLFRKMGFTPTEARLKTLEAFERVINSNLRKVPEETGYMARYRDDGKVLKPEGWVKPTFDDLLEIE